MLIIDWCCEGGGWLQCMLDDDPGVLGRVCGVMTDVRKER